jgi:hypothetical protein
MYREAVRHGSSTLLGAIKHLAGKVNASPLQVLGGKEVYDMAKDMFDPNSSDDGSYANTDPQVSDEFIKLVMRLEKEANLTGRKIFGLTNRDGTKRPTNYIVISLIDGWIQGQQNYITRRSANRQWFKGRKRGWNTGINNALRQKRVTK